MAVEEEASLNSMTQSADRAMLAHAQAIIEQQAVEIVGLRQELRTLRDHLANEHLARELREVLCVTATVGAIAKPIHYAQLLEMIVATAAEVISARAASLFLIAGEELVFEVALGEKADEAKRFRVPLGCGIAGMVAVTGQPMAIANAQNDPRHATEIAQDIGYLPESILCVPLYYADQVIGVLELLDKEGGHAFTGEDMRILSSFAQQAAVALALARMHENVTEMAATSIAAWLGESTVAKADLSERLRSFAKRTEAEDSAFREAISLAQLVHDIVRSGESEAQACKTVLRGFSEYMQLRPATLWDLGAIA